MSDYHPVSHRKAAWFHGKLASIGVLHILAGLGMIWFHGLSFSNHWRDRER